MGLPLWVKPSRLGSSVGISKVEALGGAGRAVELALRHDPRVIVEASAAGREVECSVLGNERPRPRCRGRSSPTPIGTTSRRSTSEGGMELARSGPDRRASRPPASASWPPRSSRLAGCSGLARCDFFVEPGGEVLVNEINTMPGFTETSVYAKLFEATGVAYADLCDRLVELAIERHRAPAPTSSEPAQFEQLDVADLDLVAAFLVARGRALVNQSRK